MKRYIIIACILISFQLYGQSQFNIMFYNILDFPEAPPTNRAEILKVILDEFNPDLFLVCELQSEEGANSILNNSFSNSKFKKTDFVSNQSNPNVDLQQLAFYNSDKLILVEQSIIKTHLRDINHYLFKLNTTDTEINPVFLDAFVCHLKSSSGSTNEQQRLDMVQDFTTTLVDLPEDHHVIFAGDLNLYTAQELAYQELLDENNAVVLTDPINTPGAWHNDINFQDIHTQSTRMTTIGGHGAGGGLDDRFDFMLISKNLSENTELNYVNNSYQTIGNNTNCFNKAINDETCKGDYNLTLRNALFEMSDHLPIQLQLESEQTLSIENVTRPNLFQFEKGNIITNDLNLKIDPSLIGSEIVLYNSLGQEVKRKSLEEVNEMIDATELNAGIYYILVLNTNLKPLKFVKI